MTVASSTDQRMPRVGAIILAAGASSRMGRPKQLLPVDGQTLLTRTVAAVLGAPVWPVVVVLGANADAIRPTLATIPVLAVENETWAEGMASSIRTGVIALQQFSRAMDAAVVVLCDQPALSSAMLARLVDEYRHTAAPIVAARYAERTGAPVLFAREHFAALQALTGEQGARVVVEAHASQVVAVDLPELGFDLDTPEQYEAWQQRGSM